MSRKRRRFTARAAKSRFGSVVSAIAASASATSHAELNSNAQANDERPTSISCHAEGADQGERILNSMKTPV